ncbi:MAG: flavodoxin-dependent (E)-4-hydroxy-3-methylbut-2-enyl-diphosphate synthase, partial [Candidatus Rokubacteria bacterium]|nr:flavodoxin-dependent (E)-4-hydroxy-3-methylbut-2-enyl-diphosphate synthase [Candidatus Rokubacteria bacterium]
PDRKLNWVITVTSKEALSRLGEVLGVPAIAEATNHSKGQTVLDERALYVGVRSVRRVPYAGHVHNLEVESAHSFSLPGVALHNCEVNGPGEARAADIGVAGGKGIGLIFRKGEVVRKVRESQIIEALWEEVERFIAEKRAEKTAAVED